MKEKYIYIEREKMRKKEGEREREREGEREREREGRGSICIPRMTGECTYRVSLPDRPSPNECSEAYVVSLACPEGERRKGSK